MTGIVDKRSRVDAAVVAGSSLESVFCRLPNVRLWRESP